MNLKPPGLRVLLNGVLLLDISAEKMEALCTPSRNPSMETADYSEAFRIINVTIEECRDAHIHDLCPRLRLITSRLRQVDSEACRFMAEMFKELEI